MRNLKLTIQWPDHAGAPAPIERTVRLSNRVTLHDVLKILTALHPDAKSYSVDVIEKDF